MEKKDLGTIVTKWNQEKSLLIFLEEVLERWEELRNDMYFKKKIEEVSMYYKADDLEILFVGDTQTKTVSALYKHNTAKQTTFTRAIWNQLMKECLARIKGHTDELMNELEPLIRDQKKVEELAEAMFEKALDSKMDSKLKSRNQALKDKVASNKRILQLEETGMAQIRRAQEESESKKRMYTVIGQALRFAALTLISVSAAALALHFYTTLVKTTS